MHVQNMVSPVCEQNNDWRLPPFQIRSGWGVDPISLQILTLDGRLQRPDGGGRFMIKRSVTSCRSSAEETATVSHFPSMYVLASS